jgi:Xaa-Pro aminopeptidase
MPVGDYETVRRPQARAKFRDATGTLARVKAVKSERELRLCEASAALADDALETMVDRIAVGETDTAVCAAAEELLRREGVIHTIVRVLSGEMFPQAPMSRTVADRELVCCCVELVGPFGFWVEKGAAVALGRMPGDWRAIYEVAAFAHTTGRSLLRPGVVAGDIAESIDSVVTAAGHVVGIQLGHGVGIDHDLPTISAGDQTVIERNMVVALHPHVVGGRCGAMVMDQYTVTADEPVRHSKVASQLYEI